MSLLWNCALRTIIWGASLGTAYGGIAAPLGLMIAGILYARMGALSVNPFLGVPAGMLPGIPLGIIAGATLGFVAGTVLGVINGSLLCALTYFYVLRTKDAVAYRRAAKIAWSRLRSSRRCGWCWGPRPTRSRAAARPGP